MRIMWQVTVVDRPERREALNAIGVKYFASEPPVSPSLIFEIEESGPVWNQFLQLISKWNVEDGRDPNYLGVDGALFSKHDLEAASYLKLDAREYGYPQPEGGFGYRKVTYDLTNYCQSCGIGKVQVAPFRMKGEPHWGKKRIFGINWVFDEFFVPPQVWEAVFRPIGIGRCEVLNHRTGKPLQDVVQLVIKDVAVSPLAIAGYPFEVCPSCGRKKYLPIRLGYPAFKADPGSHFCRTQEVFGSGASAWNAIVVSADVYRTMRTNKVAGAFFEPLIEEHLRPVRSTLPVR